MIQPGATAPEDLLHIVVAPAGAIHPQTGGGQRTRLFFDACVGNGPTDLVLMDDGPDPDWIASIFPGARKIHILPSSGRLRPTKSRLMRKINGARVMLSPRAAYAVDPDIARALQAICDSAHRSVLVYRYSHPFCVGGVVHAPDQGRAVCVDVDDRDDQKYTTYLQKALGRGVTQSLFGPTSIQALSDVLRTRLAKAGLVWFAAEEDIWDLSPAITAMIPNVAMVPNLPADLPPPSAGHDVLFVGSFGHKPNQDGVKWFLRQCWPQIHAAHPQARARIVGLGDWASLTAELGSNKGVDFVGPVEDLSEEYARARLAICPIADGGGSKIKVMEAAKYGRPVVSTTHSGRGFVADFVDGLQLTDTPGDFATACMGLLADSERANREGHYLQQVEARIYSRDSVVERISDGLHKVAEELRRA